MNASATRDEVPRPVRIAVLTVSDTRTPDTDTSGALLVGRAEAAGHAIAARQIVPDDVYAIRAVVSAWIADPRIEAIITTGGTGLTGRDGTPEAITPLFDKQIDGFGEMFRSLSYAKIGTSTLQSRAVAGLANATLIFCVPGSSSACADAWDLLIAAQLDERTGPCNLVELMPRFGER
jgi:molybdenum cofactor biosynthesis protein B